ncbi:hypothetical protein C8R44DRAFT_753509 [Mycena epipterygia]|nr:hypothetical protein C8R44DRAFT_753509 [Mycena epipterygia]
MSSPPSSSPPSPHSGLLELMQQLTPRKSLGCVRQHQICLNIQSCANDASEAYSGMKCKLADITNQLSSASAPRKHRHHHARATNAPDDVENPTTLEECVRSAGHHFAVEYGLFLHIDMSELFATPLDPNFNEDTEFDTKKTCIQGQLGDILVVLPDDARDITIRKHDIPVNLKDFKSSSSCFNAFAKHISHQPATDDADAFYSLLKAEVLYDQYDGTGDVYKIFCGTVLLSIYASVICELSGPKGLFEGESKLPPANGIQRQHRIKCTTPGAIVNCAVLAIWLFSSDTMLVAEGDETKIDYHFLWVTFMRQICEGLRDEARWAQELFHYLDRVLFPNTCDSLGQLPSANHQAVCNEVEAMDVLFKAATSSRTTPPRFSPPPSQ